MALLRRIILAAVLVAATAAGMAAEHEIQVPECPPTPIKSEARLRSYLSRVPRTASPLGLLSDTALFVFVRSLSFGEQGLTNFSTEALDSELSAQEVREVLALFDQHRYRRARGISNRRVRHPTNSEWPDLYPAPDPAIAREYSSIGALYRATKADPWSSIEARMTAAAADGFRALRLGPPAPPTPEELYDAFGGTNRMPVTYPSGSKEPDASDDQWDAIPSGFWDGTPDEARRAADSTGARFLAADGDFDGDGHEDRAVVRRNRASGGFAVLATLSSVPGQPVVFYTGPAAALPSFGIKRAAAGTYRTVCSNGALQDADICAKEIVLEHDGVEAFTFESASQLLAYRDGRVEVDPVSD